MASGNVFTLCILILLSLALGVLGHAKARGSFDPSVQTPVLLYEARTVYLGNLAHRDNGVLPLLPCYNHFLLLRPFIYLPIIGVLT